LRVSIQGLLKALAGLVPRSHPKSGRPQGP
jgi:hypothetical protein